MIHLPLDNVAAYLVNRSKNTVTKHQVIEYLKSQGHVISSPKDKGPIHIRSLYEKRGGQTEEETLVVQYLIAIQAIKNVADKCSLSARSVLRGFNLIRNRVSHNEASRGDELTQYADGFNRP